jgi:hypothetical protein
VRTGSIGPTTQNAREERSEPRTAPIGLDWMGLDGMGLDSAAYTLVPSMTSVHRLCYSAIGWAATGEAYLYAFIDAQIPDFEDLVRRE